MVVCPHALLAFCKWESLQPFPHDAAVQLCSRGYVVGTAVWDNTILFNMGYRKFWAYYSPKNRWYRVDVKDDECYNLVGETVVVENTIYALSHPSFDEVMALSVKRTGNDDFAFECSLRSEIKVRGLDMDMLSSKDAYEKTGHLVHLGKDNFCLVRSCRFLGRTDDDPQPIYVTNIKLKEEESMISVTVTGQHKHLLQNVDNNQFHVVYCFSLPEFPTIVLNQGKSFTFHLNPFPEDFDPTRKHISLQYAKSNVASKASTTLGDVVAAGRSVTDEEAIPLPHSFCSTLGDGAASRRSNTDKKVDGYSIYVTNIPENVTFCQLEMELKQFGPIKSDSLEVIILEKGKPRAIVEYKSRKSMQRAIEASPIMINGRRVLIKEKNSSGQTLGMCGKANTYKSKEKKGS